MKPAPSSPELEALAADAAAADQDHSAPADQTGPGSGGAAAPSPDLAREWAQFPALFGKLIAPAMPELADVYTDAACLEWGRAMVPVAERYGWTPGAFMGWLGPWAGLGIATWPLAYPTAQAVRARRAAMDTQGAQGASAQAAGEGDAASPASATVIAMPGAGDDPDLRDPTQTNRPPRPAE